MDNSAVTGTFDGKFMVSSDGKKYEVNPNYAAKSQLVYGTKLSLSVEDGKNFFKQIDKIEKQKIEGMLSKKEGEWCLLTASGVYKISDTAAKFQNAREHLEATAYVPKDKLNVPFAALDVVKSDQETKRESPILSEKFGKNASAVSQVKSMSTPQPDPKPESTPQPAKIPSKPAQKPINSLRVLTDEDLR